jgi:hypothetical protein
MVFSGCHVFFAGAGVVWREHAANKSDDGQPMLAVITGGVDVPPAIAIRRYRRVEVRSSRIAAAARMPAKAAMGTPGPGCVLPPAR